MENHEIVPDVINTVPSGELKIKFESVEVDLGNILTIKQVSKVPTEITWNADPNKNYILCFTDPDAPSRKDHSVREWVHWLVVNIPGENISQGETLIEFVPSSPGKDSGMHRYTFLVYEQPSLEKLNFQEEVKLNKSIEHRVLRRNFSIRNFALKYNLGEAFAVNFFQTEWDEYVSVIRKELGLE